MADTTGNFNDLVQLSGDTLYHLGESFILGNSLATSVGIGFSNSLGVIAVEGDATGNATLNLPAGGGTLLTNINLSAGTTSNNLSAVTFSNSNGVSFGLNGSTITASVNAGAGGGVNVAAGTQTATSGTVVLSNSNGLSFGMSGSSQITASYASYVSMFSQDADFVTNFAASNATLSLQRVSIAEYISATALGMILDFEGATNSSGAVTVSHGIYTLASGTASLASSASRQFSWTSGSATSATSQYGGASGTRYRTLGVAYNLTPGDYLFAYWIRTTNSVTVNVFGRAAMSFVGTYDGFETSVFLNGTSNSSFTTGLPSSIVATNTNYARTGAPAMRQPGVIFAGTGSN